MRINKFIALATGMSRRSADTVVEQGNVTVNGQTASAGQQIEDTDDVRLVGKSIKLPRIATVLLNKPAGYVVSRDGQGSKTIYDLLPSMYQQLKPIGRLDKDSSGLLLLTNDGNLAHELTHPSSKKVKVYEVSLNTALQPLHRQMISDYGVQLEDGMSRFELERLQDGDDKAWCVSMHEGRNRQIRRTFSALGYSVKKLHRTNFGPYQLGDLADGTIKLI
jgi:23S rRNA pseudouridine2605 synthase